MRRIRFLVAFLVIWFLLFFSVDKWGLTSISNVADVFVLAAVILTISVPDLQIISVWALLAVIIPLFLATRILAGYSILNEGLPSTIVEVGAILVSIALGRSLMAKVREFEKATVNLYLGPTSEMPESFTSKQGAIYREVRRARNHQRPLALMAIGVEEESIKANLHRLMQDVQREMSKQFALASMSRKLTDMLEDCTIIAQKSDHFLVLLPEMTPELLPNFIGRLRQAVYEQLGLGLRIGTASLEKDGWTFDGLLQKAVEEMSTPSAHYPRTGPMVAEKTEYTPFPQGPAGRNGNHETSQWDSN